jgi:DNA-binding MarR family transcriptional regulator
LRAQLYHGAVDGGPSRAPNRLSAPELAAWRGFLRVHAALIRELDADLEGRHGLPLTSYEVLLRLSGADGGRMRMAELAGSVLLSRSGLTRLCDRLVRQGLVEREAAPDDARGAYAVITPLGRERFRAAHATHLAGVRERFTDRLGPEDLERLAAVWERVLPGAAR